MAIETNIGGNGTLFIGEDKTLRLEVLTADGSTIDISGWSMIFDVRKKDTSPNPALLAKTPNVTGVFNADRLANTQRAEVVLSDDDTNLFRPQSYRYSLKRLDPGNETILAWGNFTLQKATAP